MRFALLVVVVSGCGLQPFPGAPVPGAACVPVTRAQTMPECITAGEVAFCESGKWVEYACPGECRNAQSYRCDWSPAKNGDVCPAALEGTAFCASSTQSTRCDNGKWATSPCATSCTASGLTTECR